MSIAAGDPMTTVKVRISVRDRLKAQAAHEGRTMGEHLDALCDAEERRQFYAEWERSMQENPPDEDYYRELEEWLAWD